MLQIKGSASSRLVGLHSCSTAADLCVLVSTRTYQSTEMACEDHRNTMAPQEREKTWELSTTGACAELQSGEPLPSLPALCSAINPNPTLHAPGNVLAALEPLAGNFMLTNGDPPLVFEAQSLGFPCARRAVCSRIQPLQGSAFHSARSESRTKAKLESLSSPGIFPSCCADQIDVQTSPRIWAAGSHKLHTRNCSGQSMVTSGDPL